MSKIRDREAPAAAVLGIGAVLTDAEGRVVAHAFDFDLSGYGGYTTWQAQRLRTRDAVVRKYINQYCYGDMASAIDDYAGRQIVEALRKKGKLRLTFFAIGHELDERELN